MMLRANAKLTLSGIYPFYASFKVRQLLMLLIIQLFLTLKLYQER